MTRHLYITTHPAKKWSHGSSERSLEQVQRLRGRLNARLTTRPSSGRLSHAPRPSRPAPWTFADFGVVGKAEPEEMVPQPEIDADDFIFQPEINNCVPDEPLEILYENIQHAPDKLIAEEGSPVSHPDSPGSNSNSPIPNYQQDSPAPSSGSSRLANVAVVATVDAGTQTNNIASAHVHCQTSLDVGCQASVETKDVACQTDDVSAADHELSLFAQRKTATATATAHQAKSKTKTKTTSEKMSREEHAKSASLMASLDRVIKQSLRIRGETTVEAFFDRAFGHVSSAAKMARSCTACESTPTPTPTPLVITIIDDEDEDGSSMDMQPATIN